MHTCTVAYENYDTDCYDTYSIHTLSAALMVSFIVFVDEFLTPVLLLFILCELVPGCLV